MLALGILYGTYEVQQETFPDWLFYVAVTSGILLFIGGAVTWSAGYIIVPIRTFFAARRFRSPMVRRDEPDPNQWLLDIAREEAENPVARLLVLKAEFTNKNLKTDEYRPWVEIGLTIRNVGVHSILVGRAEGHVMYKGRELPDAIQGKGGASRKPRDHEHVYKLKLFLPPDMANEFFEEMLVPRHRVYSLGLGGIKIEVTSEAENGSQGWMSLGGINFIEVRD